MEKSLFDRLISSAEEMVAIEKGEQQPPAHRVYQVKLPDVKKIRQTSQLKQQEFAEALGVSLALVQSWETNRRTPNGLSRKLLLMLEQQPSLIQQLQQI